MLAPIFKTINTPAVRAVVGNRIYGKGIAPQGTPTPYITWFTVVGDPYLNLSDAPHGDIDMIQIDCWSGSGDADEGVANQLAKAVRDALDAAGQANRVIADTRETDTMLFRISLQTDFIHDR